MWDVIKVQAFHQVELLHCFTLTMWDVISKELSKSSNNDNSFTLTMWDVISRSGVLRFSGILVLP